MEYLLCLIPMLAILALYAWWTYPRATTPTIDTNTYLSSNEIFMGKTVRLRSDFNNHMPMKVVDQTWEGNLWCERLENGVAHHLIFIPECLEIIDPAILTRQLLLPEDDQERESKHRQKWQREVSRALATHQARYLRDHCQLNEPSRQAET